MPKLIDLASMRFGRLVVVSRAENVGRTTRWNCLCDCGNLVIVRQPDLKARKTQSCGCLHREQLAERNTVHGLSKTKLCDIWRSMKDRCNNPKNRAYKNYGGRGISICNEWLTDFKAFYDWAMANGYGDNKSIDRINVNGNYEPENCRWTDYKTQANNTRANHFVEYNGKTQTIAQWADECGIKQHTLIQRLRRGWTIEKALTTP